MIKIGHWSETCGITGLPITHGSPIGILILDEKKDRENLNDGVFIKHSVVSLPIFGEYGDYGNITKIKEDKNTQAIEKYFGGNIQEIMDKLTENDGKDDISIKLTNYTYMFFRREIYDEFIKLYGEEMYESNRAYYNSSLDSQMLLELGFKLKHKDEERERYNELYENPKFKDIKIWSDGEYIRLEYNGKEEGNLYSPIRLEECLKKYHFKADFSYLKNISSSHFKLKSFKKILYKILKGDKYERFSMILSGNIESMPFGYPRYKIEKNPLLNIYKDVILNGDIDKELIEWYDFFRCCLISGIVFQNIPPIGSQDGDYNMVKRIGSVITKICDKELKERG